MTYPAPIYETLIGSANAAILIDELRAWHYMGSNPGDQQDPRIVQSITAAVSNFEDATNRKITKQRIRWKPIRFGSQDLGQCPGRLMKLPFGLNSDIAVAYLDEDDAWQTFSDYTFEKAHGSNSLIVLNSGESWPYPDYEYPYPIQIDFDCGWDIGPPWESGKVYLVGDTMIPTSSARLKNSMAYTATVGGTSGATEPSLTREIGATTAEGPGTLEWTCSGESVPYNVKQAIMCGASDLMVHTGVVLDGSIPNMNILSANWAMVVANWKLYW